MSATVAVRDADPLAREHRLRRVRGHARRAAPLPGRADLPARRREPQRARVLQPARRADPERRAVGGRPRRRCAGSCWSRSPTPGGWRVRRARGRGRTSRWSCSTTTASRDARARHRFIADDGSLVTSMLKLLLERGIADHADAGDRVRARDPRGHRLAHVLVHDARATSRRSPPACALGANQELLARYLRGPLQPRAARAAAAARPPRAPSARSRACGVVTATAQAGRLRRGRLDARLADRRRRRLGRAAAVRSRWRGACWSSARSRTPALAVDAALEPLGGGGHAQAASAIVREDDPEAVLERVRRRGRACRTSRRCGRAT